MQKTQCRCRFCGRSKLEIKGYLLRINDIDHPVGIYECRPCCNLLEIPEIVKETII